MAETAIDITLLRENPMTTFLVCDDCGIMTYAGCSDGWLPRFDDKHYCVKCRAKDIVKRAGAEPNSFGRIFRAKPP
jgi:hypothetical protein